MEGIWVPASNGQVPPNAVEGGRDGRGVMYIGRAYHGGDLLPGKIIPSMGLCFVCWNCAEHAKRDYEVLTLHPSRAYEWVESYDGMVPFNAVYGGHTDYQETLYVGRTQFDNTLTLGKVHPSHRVCYIPFNGREVSSETYEVLVFAGDQQPNPSVTLDVDQTIIGTHTDSSASENVDPGEALKIHDPALTNAAKQFFQCIICYSIPSPPPLVSRCCRSILGCRSCVRQWLREQRNCPKCRSSLEPGAFMELAGSSALLNLLRQYAEDA